MDKKQAEEILQSGQQVEVQYQDVPVWIENIQGSMADVKVIGTGKHMTVPLAELENTGRPVDPDNIYGL
ncbi:MAG: H-type small acid-soluble spore protein [Bacillota bacterium]|jgi:H-type small acid-soluble spore protein|nr:H-type small acid-soluble spore protein [Bacillota bacterium]HHU29805.1 small, acid-soluble spore protein, H family [Bacillota bacterium]